MVTPWDSFDELTLLEYRAPPVAATNQTTGARTVTTPTFAAIVGNLDEDPLSDEDRMAGGLVKDGDAILYTENILAEGGTVRVTDAAGNRDFRVFGLDRRYTWIHGNSNVRRAFILRRMQPE